MQLDKNFEMYSDTVVKEKESGIDALLEGRTRYSEATTSKISNLGVNIVRNEDPLVAIKVIGYFYIFEWKGFSSILS